MKHRPIEVSAAAYAPGRLSQFEIKDGTKVLPIWPDRVELVACKVRFGQSELIEKIVLSSSAWTAFREIADLTKFLDDAQVCGLEEALRAQLDWCINAYEHEPCNTSWTDEHSCACNDKCPCCNAEIEPHASEPVRELQVSTCGEFVLIEAGVNLVEVDSQRPR